jgi:hypothetical protein
MSLYALLLLTVLLSTSQLHIEGIVKAQYHDALMYAPNYYVEGLDDLSEEDITSEVCVYIGDKFMTYCQDYNVEVEYVANYYEYYSDAFYANYYYDDVTFFSKGHAAGYTHGSLVHHYLMDKLGEMVQDTVYGEYVGIPYPLVFIWHCGTAEDYVPNTNMFCSTCNGYATFPMALIQDNTLSLDGWNSTSGSAVFVGFQGYSPQFLSSWGLDSPYMYFHFVCLVYDRLAQNHESMNEALDYASLTCSEVNYPNSWIATHKDDFDPDFEGELLQPYPTWMEIIGYGGTHLPGY